MSYNARSPAVKRLMKEAQELAEPTELYHAQPLEDNLFEWHFTIRGPEDSDFQGGIYHGRILLPSEYPMKPPNILLLTPNGRFEIKRKICLSISGYHPESWRPCWSIRTALLAIIGFMPTHGGGAIGSLEFSSEERKKLAKTSTEYVCQDCGPTTSILLPQTEASIKDREEAKNLAKQIDFQSEKQKATTSQSSSSPDTPAPSVAPSEAPAPAQQATTGLTASNAPNMAAAFAPWMFYQFYPAMMMGQATGGWPQMPQLPQLPGQNQPLTFDQWMVQVKGYQSPTASGESPGTEVSTTSTQEPTPEPRGEQKEPEPTEENKEEKKEQEAKETNEDETEEEPKEGQEEEAQRRTDSSETRETPVVHQEESVQEAEEWPMFSLFVICFLLVVVLIINRYCLPIVYRAWRGDEL